MQSVKLLFLVLLTAFWSAHSLNSPFISKINLKAVKNHPILEQTVSDLRSHSFRILPTLLTILPPQYALGSRITTFQPFPFSFVHLLTYLFIHSLIHSIANGGDEAASLLTGYKTSVNDFTVWIVLVGGLYYLYFKMYKFLASF